MQKIDVVLNRGHMVASGRSETDTRFPGGTIRMQMPFFKERGFDFESYFEGDYILATMNLSVEPNVVQIKNPEIFFKNVKWTDIFPAENFFMSMAQIEFKGAVYKALLYIPDPSTKPDHFQAPTVVEVIAQKIPELQYGDKVTLVYNQAAVAFV